MAGRAPMTPAGTREGPAAGSSGTRFHCAVPAEPGQLAVVRRALRAWLTTLGIAGAAADDVLIGVGEAAANAIEHAYPHGAPGLLEVEVDATSDAELRVTVRDAGRWHAGPVGAAGAAGAADGSHGSAGAVGAAGAAGKGGPGDDDRGRGIAMMRAVGSDVRYDCRADGTTVRFRVARARRQPGRF